MTKTALACPEPQRRPSGPVMWTSRTGDGTGGGNVGLWWKPIDVKQ